MKFLRDWIEELQVKLRNEERHTDFLTHDLAKVRARLADRNRACNELAKQRDEWRRDACSAGAELDKLRQARAAERANPDNPGDLIEGLRKENERLQGLVKAGDEFIHVVREKVGIAGDLDGLESALGAIDELRGRVGFMDQRVKEMSEELAEKHERSKALYNDLKGAKLTLRTCQHDLEREQGRVRTLEEQAESYRKTIAELRLTRPASLLDAPSFAYADAEGPDRFNAEQSRIRELNRIVDANHTDVGGECVSPRYEVQKVMGREHPGRVIGYQVYDNLKRGIWDAWVETSEQPLDTAHAHALAAKERLEREAANRGGM